MQEVTDIQLEIHSTYLSQVTVITAIITFTVWVPTLTIGHLRLTIVITLTAYTSILPTFIGRTTTIVLTLEQFVALRIPLLKP